MAAPPGESPGAICPYCGVGCRVVAANNASLAAVDPVSKQPELKHCAVDVRPWPGASAGETPAA